MVEQVLKKEFGVCMGDLKTKDEPMAPALEGEQELLSPLRRHLENSESRPEMYSSRKFDSESEKSVEHKVSAFEFEAVEENEDE